MKQQSNTGDRRMSYAIPKRINGIDVTPTNDPSLKRDGKTWIGLEEIYKGDDGELYGTYILDSLGFLVVSLS